MRVAGFVPTATPGVDDDGSLLGVVPRSVPTQVVTLGEDLNVSVDRWQEQPQMLPGSGSTPWPLNGVPTQVGWLSGIERRALTSGLGDALGWPVACERVLEVYDFDGGPADLDFLRAVSNGQSLVWSERRGEARLIGSWVSAAGALVVGASDAEARAWSREERVSAFGDPISSPTVSTSAGAGAYVGWIELEDLGDGSWTSWVCESPVVDLLGSISRVGFRLQSVDYVSEAGMKFLASAACVDGTVYVMTAYDRGVDTGKIADQDRLAVKAGPVGGEWLAVAVPDFHDYVNGRSSDPSVGATPNGKFRVFAWEERDGESDVQRYFLVERYFGGAWQRQGAFELRLPVPDRVGGDVCVRVTRRMVYVAYQGASTGVYLARTPLVSEYGSDTVWEAVVTPTGLPEVGPGWFANLAVAEHGSEDLLAMVWEHTTESVGEAGYKLVGVAFVHSVPGSDFWVSGTFTIGSPDDGDDYFQKAPGVAIGDEAVSGLLGYVPVDIIWLSAEAPRKVYPLHVRAVLLHRTYFFDGPCVEGL